MFKWVSATDLNLWADRRDSQGQLAELLRRLAYATLRDPQRITFSSGDSIQTGGWDGIVETLEGNLFVPSGSSGWELSSEKKIRGKAESDYSKRTGDPLGIKPEESTFIFVTPRRWSEKDDWVQERINDHKWLDVKAYDANDIEQWLEQAPAVGAWFARLIGRYPEGVQALSDYWLDWQAFTRPRLPASLITETRQNEAEQLRSWLSNPPSIFSIVAETREEGVAFLAAVAEQSEEVFGNKILSRTLVVEDENSWRHLSVTKEPLILIPRFEVTNVSFAAAAHHHILIPHAVKPTNPENLLVLSPIPPEHYQKILVGIGYSDGQAFRLARETGGRLSVLRRFLAVVSEAAKPAWAKPSEGPSLTPFLLVGSWKETNDKDLKVLEAIAKRPYHEIVPILVRWVSEVDSPIRKVGDRWDLVSHEDAWKLLQGYLSNAELLEFFKQAEYVLTQINPRFELPPDERYLANVKGKMLPHSEELRKGVATSLALMGSRGKPSAAFGERLPQVWVDNFAYRLFKHSNQPNFWPSLADVLPILAEASPEQFLQSVERDLGLSPSPVMEMFTDEGMFGNSPHASLLWALEAFAWEPRYLTRVSLVIAALARLDPGGKSGNRPQSSLQEIFLPWRPQTAATLEQRFQTIDEIIKRESAVAWDLLASMLPSMQSFSMGTYRPAWRTWGSGWVGNIDDRERVQTYEEAFHRALSLADDDPRRWATILDRLNMFSPEEQAEAIKRLNETVQSGLPPEKRKVLWDSLRSILHNHTQYSDAAWALPEEILGSIKTIYEMVQPDDVFQRHQWLFSMNPQSPSPKSEDWEEEQKQIEQEQGVAVVEILAKPMVEILDFAHQVERPEVLGYAVGKSRISDDWEVQFLESNLSSDHAARQRLVTGFVAGRRESLGEEWVERYLPEGIGVAWLPNAKALFLRGLPFETTSWDIAASCGSEVDSIYWKTVQIRYLRDEKEAERAIRSLLLAGRPYTALDLASFFIRAGQAKISPQILFEVLQSAYQHELGSEGPANYTMVGYNVGEALLALQLSEEIPDTELARLEWIYFPLLEHGNRGPSLLLRQIESDPAFFVELLTLIYRSEEESAAELEVSEQDRQRATLAYELLHSWKTLPGRPKNGNGSPDGLEEWIKKARELAAQEHRRAAADSHIGQVLAHAQVGPDGIWPDVAVRRVIETVASEELDRGFQIGVSNKRGVVTKSPREGGAQERELAQYFRKNADQLAAQWPRTAGLLYQIADDYESHAHREDIRADER